MAEVDSFGSISNISTTPSCQYSTDLLNIKISVWWADRTLTLKSSTTEVAVKCTSGFLSPDLFLSLKYNFHLVQPIRTNFWAGTVDVVSPPTEKTSFTMVPWAWVCLPSPVPACKANNSINTTRWHHISCLALGVPAAGVRPHHDPAELAVGALQSALPAVCEGWWGTACPACSGEVSPSCSL